MQRGRTHSAETKARMAEGQRIAQAARRAREGSNRSPYVRSAADQRKLEGMRKPGAGGARVKAGAKKRPCLCCGTSFLSHGPHNRLCYTCRRSDQAGPFDAPHQVLR